MTMSLREQLDADLKDAMRSRDQIRLNAVRQVKSTVALEEARAGTTFDDAKFQEVITRLVRQHRESIEMYQKGNRPELVAQEEAELKVLLAYLPQQLSGDDILALTKKAAQEVGARGPADKGKVMGKLMPQIKGKAEGTEVNKIVTQYLESLAK
ncbi:MAG: GatB/YqeY domain-containing protein [Chloroflexi bacterium]|nr:GatB/YqeY domain-containing protein [Chloroflexota bacterium]